MLDLICGNKTERALNEDNGILSEDIARQTIGSILSCLLTTHDILSTVPESEVARKKFDILADRSFCIELSNWVLGFKSDDPNCTIIGTFSEYIQMCTVNQDLWSMEMFLNLCEYLGVSVPKHKAVTRDDNFRVNPKMSQMMELSDLTALTQNSVNYKVYHTYFCETIADVCVATIYDLLRQGLYFKMCRHCCRYFVPPRPNAEYCDRVAPESLKTSCKNFAKNQREMKALSKVEYKLLIRRLTNRFRTRFMRHPENVEDLTTYNTFLDKLRKYEKASKYGSLKEEDFLNWLRKIDTSGIIEDLT